MSNVSQAASLLGRRSAQVRLEKWGKEEFERRMREWGKLGGRPKNRTDNQNREGDSDER